MKNGYVGLAMVTLIAVSAPNARAQADAAAAAVKASPALIEALSQEIGSSPEQAARRRFVPPAGSVMASSISLRRRYLIPLPFPFECP